MNIFIANINKYITHYGIKQNFISIKTGIEKNKLSRLLNEVQDILQEDMNKIAMALNKDIAYFMDDNLGLITPNYEESTSIAFYMGTPTKEKEETANLIFDFLEHIDAILGVKSKIKKHSYEVHDSGI